MKKYLPPLDLCCALACLCLAACSSTPTPEVDIPPNPPPPGIARIHLYRQAHFIGCGAFPAVVVDGVKRGNLTNGSYFDIDLPPGQHHLVIGGNVLEWEFHDIKIDYAFEGGKEYFLRLEINLKDLNIAPYAITSSWDNLVYMVSPDAARNDMRGLKKKPTAPDGQ